ncbi:MULTISPECIES: SAM-dependent methyltransferase [Acinetobacter]|uniref:tRNA (guanine(46)-N(7))-methyltransferase n=1 Tax=Acinetobacter indicus TaxID=756892 RepID=A0AAW8Z1C5_9GAMM|nr:MULTISPECIES: SAM-dependent methyltransferase [Acinetobacter]MCO8100564.1 tRNA (guanine-N(7)-)-methyltransferase [Acinetobacter indicus]MCO8103495.1 tRNA (guanine-N(7)-)-methyltransferase [Acinetobacter indicus]MCO8106102.1 tRNA (guanine-N(7)-)-methyltransferase [Acinetobacter indicus]MCO8111776.1 tRNA (guanine-N(7)-)-methyltransferase [Acinetobacter indicus]MDM1262642.1 SAM-dependent methyltransferase [Acinetobacter indicus]
MIMPIRQFQAQRMHAPRDFQAIANTPVCVEIGAGKGKHALLFSGQHPEQTLYAIERTREKFLAMQKQHGLEPHANLQPVHADALPWIVHALYPAQVEQCFILYPNPEPHNPAQRWLNMPFFEFLLSRLQPNGQITLASNIPEYIAEAEQQLLALWKLPFEKQRIAADSARTHFEIKYLQRGELCQQLIIRKPEGYRTRFDDFQPLQGQSPAQAVEE